MTGNVNTLNATSCAEKWLNEIPEIYRSIVIAIIKSRLNIGNDEVSTVCLAATNQSNLLLFVRGKLLKNGQLPFKDCKKLYVYRSCHLNSRKEFVVASSSDRAAVIDLSNLQVVKEWDSVKSVKVKDHFKVGQSQIIISFWYSEDPVIVTENSEWEAASRTEHMEEAMEETPLQGVIQALKVQLRNSQKNLLDIEQQTSLRRCLLNRSLASLRENLKSQSSFTDVPTFLTPLTTIPDVPALPLEPVKIASVSPWQIVVGQNWIIGIVFEHSYTRALFDIECIFSTFAAKCQYQIHYHLLEKSPTISLSNAGLAFLSTTDEFNSELEPNQSLAIIVTTSIPYFKDNMQSAKGSIFLACKLKTETDPQIIQAHLGSVSLSFPQFSSRSYDLRMNPRGKPLLLSTFFLQVCRFKVADITSLRRNLLSMSALLEAVDDVSVTTYVSSAPQSFSKMMEELQLVDLSPFPCYYGHGIFGHVVLGVRVETQRCLSVKIRAQSSRHLSWLIQSLKSALPDDAKIVRSAIPPESLDAGRLERRISLALSLFDSCQTDDIQVMENSVPTPDTNATAVEQIRSEFMKRQSALLNPGRQVAEILKVAPKIYEKWQIENGRN